jgi:hypothetical protein
MKHQEFIGKTQDYINGDLSEADSADYETHFFNCPACRDHLFAQQAVISAVREVIQSRGMQEAAESLDLASILKLIRAERAGLPQRSQSELERDSTGLQQMKKALIKLIRSLDSSLTFSYSLVPQATRGGPLGQTIVLKFEPPRKMDGHLTVFHYDEENNIEIVFPKNRDDTIFLGKDEKRRVLIPTTEPKGKHFLKAVLTPQQIVDTRLVEAQFPQQSKRWRVDGGGGGV